MNCFVCNRREWTNHYKNLEKCVSCGFIRAKDKYFRIQSEDVYSNKYFFKGEYLDYKKEGPALEKNFKNRLELIKKHIPSGKLLEIGCAHGYFLKKAKKYYSVTGIDVNSQTVKIAKNISRSEVLVGSFLKKKLLAGSFDLVCLFDTIEHLKNPREYLTKINKILSPKGILVIETGDIESFLSKFQKNKWRLINPKIHLSYFSKRTLTTILKKTGFKVIKKKYVSQRRSLAQIIYQITNKKIVPPKFMFNISLKINTYDLILVIAQKRPY